MLTLWNHITASDWVDDRQYDSVISTVNILSLEDSLMIWFGTAKGKTKATGIASQRNKLPLQERDRDRERERDRERQTDRQIDRDRE